MSATIKRNLVLKNLEVKHDTVITPHAVKFVKNNGELVYLPKCIPCGLSANMKSNRLRGLVAVDNNNEKTGHVYPVNIDSIVEYNGMRVIL
jgi:hypothetical protein